MKEMNRQFSVGPLVVKVFENRKLMGSDAAHVAAGLIQQAIRKGGKARVIFAAADSQLDMVADLTATSGIDWNAVEAFHMDEYVGIPTAHPESFGAWLKRNVVDKVHPGTVHYIAGDAKDIGEECQRYAKLLTSAPIDICFLGIGENGHIGFNDPPEADFSDPHIMKVVTLDERCRGQQVGEGHWPNLSSVPKQGITITCPALVNVASIISCVPGPKKAEAVRDALEGPISTACPGSLIRTRQNAQLYLDLESASLLSRNDRS